MKTYLASVSKIRQVCVPRADVGKESRWVSNPITSAGQLSKILEVFSDLDPNTESFRHIDIDQSIRSERPSAASSRIASFCDALTSYVDDTRRNYRSAVAKAERRYMRDHHRLFKKSLRYTSNLVSSQKARDYREKFMMIDDEDSIRVWRPRNLRLFDLPDCS
jgi:hypothetical protein